MSISTWGSSNMSRLPFASPRFFALLALVAAGTGSAALAAEACPGGKDLVLINGVHRAHPRRTHPDGW